MILRVMLFIQKLVFYALMPFAHVLAFLIMITRTGDYMFPVFNRYGLYLFRRHYYLPIPDEDDIGNARSTELVGIDMNDEGQLRFADEVLVKYKSEFSRFPAEPDGNPHHFHLLNRAYMAGDADTYYALIRHLKPRTVIEIGAGNSTLIASHALQQNMRDSPDYACNFIVIEPYPAPWLKTLPEISQLNTSKLQAVDPAIFSQLGANDILFIDSSHVLKSGGDVWLEFCEIIPRLKSGVYIHVHDVSLPKPYPMVYYRTRNYWTEQYVLQALLTNNSRLQVVWASTYMFEKHRPRVLEVFSPGLDMMLTRIPGAEPSSFWMKVV